MTDRADRRDPAHAAPYATGYHAPVLYKEVVDGLVTDPAGTYVDGTLGGGGHAAALLDRLGPDGCVIGIDQDPEALAAATARLDAEGTRFRTLRGNFGDLERLLADAEIESVDGVLLDLGVSSHQIDEAGRGFAYAASGPLDMRMDTDAPLSAADLVNRAEPDELVHILRAYGEEPRASKVVRAILDARPIETTGQLADAVRSAVFSREEVKTLSRVFQALRIAVNDELAVLERALVAGLRVLKTGGRMAVIAYHSLEDRRAKQFLRYGNFEGEPVRDFYGNLLTPWDLVTRKPITASDDEIAANPRARSARLRIAAKRDPETSGLGTAFSYPRSS
ncbi:MAG: 16S rRNA (cytosine(1402)-N(4))-methyltransferase RsmH [Rhodothermales bacterium]